MGMMNNGYNKTSRKNNKWSWKEGDLNEYNWIMNIIELRLW